MPNGEDNFVAWDSGDNKASAATAAGVKIPSDWNFDAAGGNGLAGGISLKVELKARGLGEQFDGNNSFQSVLIEGFISVASVGENSSTIELNLHNFLTQVDPS